MSEEAIKAIKMVYANTTKHDWPDDIWDAICQALASEQEQRSVSEHTGEPVALKPCGYASAEKKMCRKCGQVHAGEILDTTLQPKQEQGGWRKRGGGAKRNSDSDGGRPK